ncbi:uncharacterized protein METZ01_LOCUS133418 [marine metagenome]|uniref:Uncharacterized protein n=1 Tax=marine metagenome TaxID=408172 RepID=A0A381YUC7_9ZZZZ
MSELKPIYAYNQAQKKDIFLVFTCIFINIKFKEYL